LNRARQLIQRFFTKTCPGLVGAGLNQIDINLKRPAAAGLIAGAAAAAEPPEVVCCEATGAPQKAAPDWPAFAVQAPE